MPTNNLIAVNSIFVNETPMVFLEGAAHAFNFNYLGTGTIDSATFALYRNKTNVSATALSTTTGAVAGRTISSGLATFSLAGDYMLICSAVSGSDVDKRALKIMITKLGAF